MKREDGIRVRLAALASVAALGGFLFGFDTAVISGTIRFVKAQFALDAVAEGWFVSSALFGCIVGVSLAGWLADRFGRKPTLLLSASLFLLSALGCMIAGRPLTLTLYRFIGGMGVGIASMVSPLYISEISPSRYRGRLVSVYQLAITVGILVAYFLNAMILDHAEGVAEAAGSGWWRHVLVDELWRGMFGMEMFPAALFMLLLLLLVPESPRWLARRGRSERALTILERLGGPAHARDELRAIEESLEVRQASLATLFRPGLRLALLIGVALALLSQLSGINAIIYYGPRILEEAGFKISEALGGQVTIGIVNVVFTFGAILTVDRFGRRPVLITGVLGIVVSLLAVGLLFALELTHGPAVLVVILLFIAFFAYSYGPVTWVILSEIYPTAVRGRAMSLATLAIWVGAWLIGQGVPWLLEHFGPASTFWLFAVATFPAVLITWKLVPETKGRTLEEIERYWR